MRGGVLPETPCTSLIGAADRDVFRDGSGRATMAAEAGVIETLAARHVVGMPLGKGMQPRTIRLDCA